MSSIKEDMDFTGHLKIRLNGEIVRDVPNVVVTTGKGFVATRMAGTTDAVMSHMAIGTGTTAASPSQSALISEHLRLSLTSTGGTPDAANTKITYNASFPAVANQSPTTVAVTEAGIFNASNAGKMLCRTKFDPVNKGVADSLAIEWVITIS